jgi:tetratricopeptide (TPR) repeat protein
MEYKLLQEKYTKCCQLVTNNRLHEAFAVLHEMLAFSPNGELNDELEDDKTTYTNILRYSFGEVEDPEKTTVYLRLLRSVIELADNIREHVIVSKQLRQYTSQKKEYTNQLSYLSDETSDLIDSLKQLANDELVQHDNNKAFLYKTDLKRLFTILWLTDKYREAGKESISDLIRSNDLHWWDKSLMVSAITLSLQRYFEEAKLSLLIEAYKKAEDQVWQRALVGVLITLYQYKDRIHLYPKLKSELEELHEGFSIEKHVETAIIQFIKARDTEKIAQKFQNEILPEMSKIQKRIYDKMDIKDIIPDALQEDKNPDWENVFQDSPGLMDKLEEMSMLQMEGSDVFMSTFAMLKQFPFFNEIENWFRPFHKEDPEIDTLLGHDDEASDITALTESIEKSSIMCNSDKYSFCLNLKHVPQRERKMMVEMFSMEAKAMEEIADDDKLLRKPNFERVVFSQYIQDLYRFNKLYFFRDQFYDVFGTEADFHSASFFNWLIKDVATIRNIGEFYFEKGYYEDAIEVFKQIDTLPENIELWQKIAFSYQKLGDFDNALQYYLRSDLTDIKKPWNTKKIALCYNRLGNYQKAIEYYQEAEKMEPENIQIQANLAHNYFDMKDYENALKIYFKVEYLAPDNLKILRPIAWCSFMLNKPGNAKKYYEKIADADRTKYDLLNLGHAEWCMGNKQKAIDYYKLSVTKANMDLAWFADELNADSEMLINYGIDPVNIPLMRDYIQIAVGK